MAKWVSWRERSLMLTRQDDQLVGTQEGLHIGEFEE